MSELKSKYSKMSADLNWEIARVSAIAAVGAFTYGFDLNWWGAAIAHPYFNSVFGELESTSAAGVVSHSLTATQQSVGTAVSSIGSLVGGLVAPGFAKRYGFRMAILLSAVVVLVGSLIQITCDAGGARRYWQLVTGKLIVTLAVGMNSINLPIYLIGVAPPSLRGAVVNLYTTTVVLAALVASSTVLGLQHVMDHRVYLVPIGIQMTTPVITIATLIFIPETPQWLILKGRSSLAVEVLRSFRPGYTLEDIEAEVNVISALLEDEKKSKKLALVACFQKANRKRTMTVIGIFCLFQAQGIQYILSYFAVLLNQIGLSNVFELLVIIYSLLFFFTLISMLYQDAIGRRPGLIVGAAGMTTCMIGFAAVLSAYPISNKAASNAGIALIMFWVSFFASSWYSLSWTIGAELPAIHLRPISIALGNCGVAVVGLIVLLVSPYLQNAGYADLGPKIGYIYGSFSLISLIFAYFMVPELRGRSPIEIDWLFQNNVPIRKMKNFPVPVLGAMALTAMPLSDVKEDIEMVENRCDDIPPAVPHLGA